MGSVIVTWTDTPLSIGAAVQPLSASYLRAEYGERADRMKLIILPNGAYTAGDGVWLTGENAALPPWLVISVAQWLDLTALTIEKRA